MRILGGLSILILALSLMMDAASAANRALLIGVSEYDRPEVRQLRGPVNDVQLMRKLLSQRGFAEADILTLAANGSAAPTRANIMQALAALAAKAQPDDFVYLHFAGHGSQQPASPSAVNVEIDGLDEIFLPRDIGRWDESAGRVQNAISDDEIGAAINRIRGRGAFVWAVFDSCHSGTLTRSSGFVTRNVRPQVLGIPASVMKPARTRGGAGETSASLEPAALSASGVSGGLVAFFAAQTNELAPELSMPRRGLNRMQYGLFTYTLAAALSDGKSTSYRQLAQRILQKYAMQSIGMVTPLFEGTHLDAPVFGRKAGARVRQWKAAPGIGDNAGTFYLPAGELHGVGTGSVLAILDKPTTADEDALGYVKTVSAGLFSSQLEPLDYAGKPAPMLAKVSPHAYYRLALPVFNFTINVALPEAATALSAAEKQVLAHLSDMSRRQQGPGLRLRWTAKAIDADIRLAFSPQAASGQTACPRNRLWLLNVLGELDCGGPLKPYAIDFAAVDSALDDKLEQSLMAALGAMGKAINLERLADRFSGSGLSKNLKLTLLVRKKDSQDWDRIDFARPLVLQDGDEVRLQLENAGKLPIDATVLFIGSRFGIVPIYPLGEASNRIVTGGRVETGGTIETDTLGRERLVVIASEAQSKAEPADFRFLAQQRLQVANTLRGAASGGADSAFSDLLKAAGFGATTRGVAGAANVAVPFSRANVRSVWWTVNK